MKNIRSKYLRAKLSQMIFMVSMSFQFLGAVAYSQSPPPTAQSPTSAPPATLPANPEVQLKPKSEGPSGFNKNDPNAAAPAYSLSIFSGMMDSFDYDPRGRRDPFGQAVPDKPMQQGLVHGPMLPLQRFELNQLRLTAIIWDVHSPKAMLKDPAGAIYVVTPNTKIGPRNGYVATIREGEIVVVETIEQDGRLISTAQVVKIAK